MFTELLELILTKVEMIKKIILISLLLISTWKSQASPCSEILFDFVGKDPVEILHHELTIKWAYNSGCEGHDKRSSTFVIELLNIFDEVLLIDTVNGFNYTIKPENLESSSGMCVFYVHELGDLDKYSVALQTSKTNINIPKNPIERLNTFLLNGYFLNALSILEQLERQDLLTEISEQFSLLYPLNYPDEFDFFNSYLSLELDRLVIMPYVTGLDVFITNLNNRKSISGGSFNIELLISTNNKVVSFKTEPASYEPLIMELIENLSFQNNLSENATVLIKVSKSENGKKYQVSNERALLDQKSNNFRKIFPYRGAVH